MFIVTSWALHILKQFLTLLWEKLAFLSTAMHTHFLFVLNTKGTSDLITSRFLEIIAVDWTELVLNR